MSIIREKIIIPSRTTIMNTKADRVSKGDAPEYSARNGMVGKPPDIDMESRKRNMRIDGRKKVVTGRNILDIPCCTRVDSGRISSTGRRNTGLGCAGT